MSLDEIKRKIRTFVSGEKSNYKSWIIDFYLNNLRAEFCQIYRQNTMNKIIQENKLEDVTGKINEIRSNIQKEGDILEWLFSFNWRSDPWFGVYDASPDIYKIAHNIIQNNQVDDDCDGAARFTHYLYRFLDENTGQKTKLTEYAVIPLPLMRGIVKSHVILAVENKNSPNKGKFYIFSNGKMVGRYDKVEHYAKDYALSHGADDYFLAAIPKNNMDEFLQKRYKEL